MADFISGPTLRLSAEQIAGLTGGVPSADGGKEIYIDSSAARAEYFEAMSGPPPGYEAPPAAPVAEPMQAPTIDPASDPGLPPNVLAALRDGKPLTPEMMTEMPPPFPTRPPTMLKPNGFPAQSQAQPYSPAVVGSQPPARGFPETPGLVVRVGRGMTATVTFSGEPAKKHWERLQKFIEVAAEEIEDEPENLEESLVRRGIIPPLNSFVPREQTDAGGPRRRRKRQDAASATEPADAGAHHGGD